MRHNFIVLSSQKKEEQKMTQYRCQRCKETVLPTDMKIVPGIKCPKCGNRILFKERPPIVRKVKAR